MDAVTAYKNALTDTLERAFSTQDEQIRAGAKLLCDASMNGNNIFAFGCSHAMLPMLELYYRTGGMANINPVRAPGLCLDIDPATMTSELERMPDYGRVIINALPMKKDDVIIIHSVSGRNTVPVDAALTAKKKGAKVIVLTNMEMTKSVKSRHPSGLNLYQTADIVIDNCGCFGDSAVQIDGIPEKLAPTSTAVAAAIMNAMIAQAAADIIEAGGTPPIFISANTDEGDAHNQRVLRKHRKNIFYM